MKDDSHNHTIANVDGLQTALNGKASTSHTHDHANITGMTANRALISNASGVLTESAVTSTELGYLDGVTSAIQTQLNGKAASSHTHSGTQVTGLTASRALVSNSSGQVAVSAVTSTELGYLDGVTSSVQTQLNSKLPQIIGYYGSDASGSNGWYKVCTVSQSGNSDYSINLLFTQSFYRQATGILYVHTRCDNTTKITIQSLKWMYRMGFSAGDVKVVTGTNTWSLYVQQTASQYGRIQVQVLSKSGTSRDTTFMLSSNTTKETTTPGGTAATDGATVNSANSAAKLSTARNIALSGDVTGSVNFDGSANVTLTATVKDDSHNHTIANVDGLQDALDNITAGSVSSASKWTTARNINGMSVDGSANRFNYGTCSTAAGTAAKTVACTGFTLATGSEITVKFTVTNTAANPTLNVNGTGAKAVYYNGAAISAGYLKANKTYTFRYNGTQYDLVGDVDTNTTYSLSSFGITATAAELNKLDGVTATATELNYVHGVTSNIQTQLNGKLSTSGTAAKATADSKGQNIADTYIKGLSVSGRTITYTKGDGGTGTITTQDTTYTHPNSGVTAGTYKSVTVNAQGHVTAGSNPTTLAGYGITDACKLVYQTSEPTSGLIKNMVWIG